MYLDLVIFAVFILVYSTVAEAIERTWISGAIIFTAFGLLIGPVGLDLIGLQDLREGAGRDLAGGHERVADQDLIHEGEAVEAAHGQDHLVARCGQVAHDVDHRRAGGIRDGRTDEGALAAADRTARRILEDESGLDRSA